MPKLDAVTRAVGTAIGTFAVKSGLLDVHAAQPKHRLPRKLKKALKKARLAADET